MHANHKLGSSKPQEAGLQDKLQTRIGGILAGGITIKGLSNGEKRRCVFLRLGSVAVAVAEAAVCILYGGGCVLGGGGL